VGAHEVSIGISSPRSFRNDELLWV